MHDLENSESAAKLPIDDATSTHDRAWCAGSADVQLIRRGLQGDRDAIDSLAIRMKFLSRLLVVLNRKHGKVMTPDELEEIAQDSVATALEKLGSFDGTSTLETWLYAYGSFHYANAFRKKLRRSAKASRRAFDEDVADLAATNKVDVSSDRMAIEFALEKLGPPGSEIIRRRFFHEQSFEDIAEHLGEKVATVKTWFYRGLRELESKLRGGGQDE